MTKKKATETKDQEIVITPPDIRSIPFKIRGTAPYVQARFTAKAMQAMRDKMEAGPTAKTEKKPKAPRDFADDYQQAMHISEDGWHGIPASAFRNAMISACRVAKGPTMTLAKLTVFVKQDGNDRVDGIPLVRIEGKPERTEMAVRNATGVADIRVRPMWRKWSANVVVQYDADQFTPTSVANLMLRAGAQVGIGEGRHDSHKSAGMGWGTFEFDTPDEPDKSDKH
jgi:hypothetical protein